MRHSAARQGDCPSLTREHEFVSCTPADEGARQSARQSRRLTYEGGQRCANAPTTDTPVASTFAVSGAAAAVKSAIASECAREAASHRPEGSCSACWRRSAALRIPRLVREL